MQETLTPALLSVLLQDTSKLLRPSPVSILPETEYNSEDSSSSNARSPYASHANFNLILALSDLSALFQSPSIPSVMKSRGKENRITHKLSFYAAKVIGTPSVVLGVVSEEVMMRMKSIEREELKTQGERTHGGTDSTQKLTLSASSNPPLIEELPSS